MLGAGWSYRRGRAANVLWTRPLNGLEDLAYDFGEEPVEKVFIDGIAQ